MSDDFEDKMNLSFQEVVIEPLREVGQVLDAKSKVSKLKLLSFLLGAGGVYGVICAVGSVLHKVLILGVGDAVEVLGVVFILYYALNADKRKELVETVKYDILGE